ncbi:J domain-containing protein, partial [Sphingobium sp. AS12]|uniref:J domain-containing protein n=1 Tax=Sphingobium sp. AS12 TaxID=2849495 RepID=UPI001C31A7EB|nr:J domain-containing protein [Sphingobium sp. AS12]
MMGDAKGFYAALELDSSASATEIKAAYRRLAKEHHPDTGRVRDGGARFQQIIPTCCDADSRRGFPNRQKYESMVACWRAWPWVQRSDYGTTL